MTDAVDEWVVSSLNKFEEKSLLSAARGSLDLPASDEEKKELEEQTTLFSDLTEKMLGKLEEQVSEVRVTNRLTDDSLLPLVHIAMRSVAAVASSI